MPKKINYDDIDPVSFFYIWLNDLEQIEEVVLYEKLNVEKTYHIIDSYRILSDETKRFLQLLHEIPNETLELLSGEYAHKKGNKKKNFYKFLNRFVRPGTGRLSTAAQNRVEKIKMELTNFVKELEYEKD